MADTIAFAYSFDEPAIPEEELFNAKVDRQNQERWKEHDRQYFSWVYSGINLDNQKVDDRLDAEWDNVSEPEEGTAGWYHLDYIRRKRAHHKAKREAKEKEEVEAKARDQIPSSPVTPPSPRPDPGKRKRKGGTEEHSETENEPSSKRQKSTDIHESTQEDMNESINSSAAGDPVPSEDMPTACKRGAEETQEAHDAPPPLADAQGKHKPESTDAHGMPCTQKQVHGKRKRVAADEDEDGDELPTEPSAKRKKIAQQRSELQVELEVVQICPQKKSHRARRRAKVAPRRPQTRSAAWPQLVSLHPKNKGLVICHGITSEEVMSQAQYWEKEDLEGPGYTKQAMRRKHPNALPGTLDHYRDTPEEEEEL